MPGAFYAPWQGSIPVGSGPVPFDYRINTSFYSEEKGPLRQSTNGSVLPWEYGLTPESAAIYTEQGFRNVNMESANMRFMPIPGEVPAAAASAGSAEAVLPASVSAIGI